MTTFLRPLKYAVSLLLMVLPLMAYSEIVTKDDVTIAYDLLEDNTIMVRYAKNESSGRIKIKIDGVELLSINAGSSAQIQKIAKKKVSFDDRNGSGPELWVYRPLKRPVQESATIVENKETAKDVSLPSSDRRPTVADKAQSASGVAPRTESGELSVNERINQDSFFGMEAVKIYTGKCESLSNGLSQAGDKAQFIIDNDVDLFISESESEISLKRDEIPFIAQNIILSSNLSDNFVDNLVDALSRRLAHREQALQSLKSVRDNVKNEEDMSIDHPFKDNILNYSIVAAIIAVLVIWMVFALIKKRRKSKKGKPRKEQANQPVKDEANPSIVVRRRTTSILKKQSLDDVVNNPEYLVIDSSEFAQDSAVRNIYVKNSCIKEVYNLYAEDLRNSENPKEDGCMVLGRWVYDEAAHVYDISLEYVVFPGDDAVFKEYELNFGGKIKLRIAEKLRKLRRETNLQYDLVCWIHSHPGLGVFFSNSDDSVQMQLKHSQHPNFLIAFVIDILTSDQELGIFTFRKDGTMNAKGDLTKMYSLEEMYKWALANDKVSFNRDNCYNILSESKKKVSSCLGIEMNNSSIIDLTQLIIEQNNGIIGWAVGTSIDVSNGREYIVSSVVRDTEKPMTGILGALVSVTHFSLPTIQRLLGNESRNLKFVMVYSTKLMTLTSIPVVDGVVLTDEQYYGDETIDDLKIWTRRKR